MISVITIDDDQTSLDQLRYCISFIPQLNLKAEFHTIADALAYLHREGRVNYIFCDIELPGINGIEGADKLKRHCDELVFVTGHGHYALASYKSRVKAFLVKPVTANDLLSTIEELQGFNPGQPNQPNMTMKSGKLYLYDPSKKYYFPTFPDQVIKLVKHKNDLYTYVKSIEYPIALRCTVTEAYAILQGTGLFLRINHGTIVNIDAIEGATPTSVIVAGKEYFVGKKYQGEFDKFLGSQQLGKGNKIR